MEMRTSKIQRGPRYFFRLLSLLDREEIRPRLLRKQRQLLNRGRTVGVAGNEHHLFLFLFHQPLCQLPATGRFSGSLQPGHKDYCWRNSREVNVSLLSAHEGDQFVVDDPNESLTRCKTTNDFLADCFFPDPRNEFLDYRQSDIRFQQRHAHFAQCILNIVFR